MFLKFIFISEAYKNSHQQSLKIQAPSSKALDASKIYILRISTEKNNFSQNRYLEKM